MVYNLKILKKFQWKAQIFQLLHLRVEESIASNKYEIQGVPGTELRTDLKLLVENIENHEIYVLEYFLNEDLMLYRISAEVASLITEIRSSDYTPNTTNALNVSSIPEFIKHIKLERPLHGSHTKPTMDFKQISFYKPLRAHASLRDVPLNIDPKKYILEKYYTYVYSMNTTLSYFVKTNLGKLRMLCKNNTKGATEATILFRKVLEEVSLSITDFDIKFTSFSDHLPYEAENINTLRDQCIYQDWKIKAINALPQNDEIKRKLISIFKIRELRLQIIICLELLNFTTLDRNFINFQSKYKDKLQISAINIMTSRFMSSKMKKKKKKAEGPSHKALDLCELLDIWVDKLCIAETLLLTNDPKPEPVEKRIDDYIKNRILIHSNEESSLGLYRYILVPNYSRKLANAVNFISTKLRGTSFSKKILENKQLNSAKKGSGGGNSQSTSNTPKRVPLLKRKTASNLSDFLQDSAKHTLQRTKSDINLLEKRLTPLSDVFDENHVAATGPKNTRSINKSGILEEAEPDEVNAMLVNGRPVKIARLSSTTSSFQRVGKKPSTLSQSTLSIAALNSSSQIQVEATPLSKGQNADVIQSPQISSIVNSPLMQFASTRKSPYDDKAEQQDRSAEPAPPVRRLLFPSSP